MLTITRSPDEAIRIGDDIRLRVKKITPWRTELVIECPQDMRVLRGEVADRQLAPQKEVASGCAS
jgi:sRNA-binding carbon storage regulator CsrA